MLIWVRMGDAGGTEPPAQPVKTTAKKASKAKKAVASDEVALPDADPAKAVKK